MLVVTIFYGRQEGVKIQHGQKCRCWGAGSERGRGTFVVTDVRSCYLVCALTEEVTI